jgi:hypothetical protein
MSTVVQTGQMSTPVHACANVMNSQDFTKRNNILKYINLFPSLSNLKREFSVLSIT